MVPLILKRTSYKFEVVLEAEKKEGNEWEGGGNSCESYRYKSCMLSCFLLRLFLPLMFAASF